MRSFIPSNILSSFLLEVLYPVKQPTYLVQSLAQLDSHQLKLALSADTYLIVNLQYGGQVHARSSYHHDTFYLTDRKSTRLNSSHLAISYAVFCLKKKKK